MDSKPRAEELIAKFMEGLSTAPEIAELQQLIILDPAVADAYAKATRFEGMLGEYFSHSRTARETRQLFEDAHGIAANAIDDSELADILPVSRIQTVVRKPVNFVGLAIVATILVAMFCVLIPFNGAPVNPAQQMVGRDQERMLGGDPAAVPTINGQKDPKFDDAAELSGPPVAVITQMIGARFSRAGFTPVVGDQFRTGLYRLTSGIIELTFAHSPEIILEAPCEFDLKGRELMLLHRGRIAAKVPKGAGDFTIETPSATVIDKGTEFAVQVDDKDDSEVHVFDGMVSVTPRTELALAPAILYGRSASSISKKSKTPCGIDVDGDRFLRSLSEPDSAYARLVLNWRPEFYYRMMPTGGTIHDSSPHGIAASVKRGESEGTPWTVGRIGSALQFGGPSSKDYAVVPDYPKTTNGTLSMAAWVFAKSRPRSATIAKNWAGDERGQFHFGLHHDDGQIEISISDGEGQEITTRERTAFPIGKWQHVAFVADGGVLRLYRNGIEVNSVPYSGIGGDPKLKVLGIGVKMNSEGNEPDISRLNDDDPGISDYWHGRIDELALFNHPLTAEQIKELYESTE